jgi:23S rRNA (adenine2503-C2)-methyltransferase
MPALSDMDRDRLATEFSSAGCNPAHAKTLLRHFHDNCGQINWSELTVGHRVQKYIEQNLPPRQSRILSRHVSADRTTKLLIGFDAGGAVEAVLMPSSRPDRAAGCVSSQIGCAMGCDFCASTKNGLERNLSAGEIVEQFLLLRAAARELGRRLTSLVFMGMGEPMLNLPAVIDAIRIIAGPQTGALGWRQITVSTVGIVPGIDALADADLNVHLALSLHAPDDPTRAKLVPMNRRYPVAQIIDAARRFQEKAGRVVTIEYCLLADVNDSDDHARMLATLLKDFRAHVNVIPYNPIGPGLSGKTYQRPHELRVERFLSLLRDAGTVAHRRDTRGDDVNAACGQLKAQMIVSQ